MSLGWQRRAEVYIAGKGSEAPPPQRDEPPPEPVVPEPEQHPDDFDRYIPQIQRCNPDYAKGLAARLLGYLAAPSRASRRSTSRARSAALSTR